MSYVEKMWRSDGRVQLCCPQCDDPNGLHIGKPGWHPEGEYDPANPLKLRGRWISVPLSCEFCGDNPGMIAIGFHKGTTYAQVVPATRTRRCLKCRREFESDSPEYEQRVLGKVVFGDDWTPLGLDLDVFGVCRACLDECMAVADKEFEEFCREQEVADSRLADARCSVCWRDFKVDPETDWGTEADMLARTYGDAIHDALKAFPVWCPGCFQRIVMMATLRRQIDQRLADQARLRPGRT